jgi:type III secretion protein U
MSDDSEEKTLEPTDHKLRKAREKGQIPTSQDFVAASVTVSIILYLLFAWPSMLDSIGQIFRITVDAAPRTGPEGIMRAFDTVTSILGVMLLPFGVIAALAAIIANVVHHKGIPFSMHPVTPDFNRINPGQIFKKVFSKRNAAEFAISLLRIAIWFAIAVLLVWLTAPQILAATLCEGPCVLNVAMKVFVILLAALVIMLIVFGLGDLPLQNALFRHEQKMGHREMTREMKDTQGNPEVRSHRRSQHRESVESPGGGGGGPRRKAAETLILAGHSCAVGIYYHAKESPVPVIVSRHGGTEVRAALSRAAAAGVAVVEDAKLAADLFQSVGPNNAIRERHFARVAQHMVNEGLL